MVEEENLGLLRVRDASATPLRRAPQLSALDASGRVRMTKPRQGEHPARTDKSDNQKKLETICIRDVSFILWCYSVINTICTDKVIPKPDAICQLHVCI